MDDAQGPAETRMNQVQTEVYWWDEHYGLCFLFISFFLTIYFQDMCYKYLLLKDNIFITRLWVFPYRGMPFLFLIIEYTGLRIPDANKK
ncbi:hypothetical protein ACJX0J_020558, partial [Zea mays]